MHEKFLKDGKKNMEYRIKLTDQFLDEFKKLNSRQFGTIKV